MQIFFSLLELEREDLNNNSWLVRLIRCNPFWAIFSLFHSIPIGSNATKSLKIALLVVLPHNGSPRSHFWPAWAGQTTGSSELFGTKLHQVATAQATLASRQRSEWKGISSKNKDQMDLNGSERRLMGSENEWDDPPSTANYMEWNNQRQEVEANQKPHVRQCWDTAWSAGFSCGL